MSVLCKMGMHGRIITGLGGMGDAHLCLRCGKETYWPLIGSSYTEADQGLWPEIERARNLPGGVNTLIKEPDPEFDRWIWRRRRGG